MNAELRRMCREKIVVEGGEGKAALARAARKSTKMIDRYLDGQTEPSSHVCFHLALACGADKKRALTLAGEAPAGAKESA